MLLVFVMFSLWLYVILNIALLWITWAEGHSGITTLYLHEVVVRFTYVYPTLLTPYLVWLHRVCCCCWLRYWCELLCFIENLSLALPRLELDVTTLQDFVIFIYNRGLWTTPVHFNCSTEYLHFLTYIGMVTFPNKT